VRRISKASRQVCACTSCIRTMSRRRIRRSSRRRRAMPSSSCRARGAATSSRRSFIPRRARPQGYASSKTSPGSWLRAARHDDKNPAFPEPGATRALHRTVVLILPAIDIRGGRCVRLVQGDYAKETVFGDDPAEMAERWLAEGAEAIHIVDLDGARDGTATNREAVLAILRTALVAGRGVVTELG